MFQWLYDWLGLIPAGMLVPDKFPEARAFINRMHEEAKPFIAARTIVFYGATAENDPAPYIIGTGVPLEVAGQHLILTAAHLFDEVIPERQAVYVGPGSAGGKLIGVNPLNCLRSIRPASGKRVDDHYDSCVVILPPDVVEQLGPRTVFCRLEDMDPFDSKEMGSYYFLNGFPSENLVVNRCKQTVRCKSLPYGTIIYDGSRGPWPLPEGVRLDPDLHVDLDFHPRRAADDAGRRTRLPRPHGISGCGLWRLSQAGVVRTEWSVAHVKLIGIENRYDEVLYVLRGTTIKQFNTILRDRIPGALAAMNAIWGAAARKSETSGIDPVDHDS